MSENRILTWKRGKKAVKSVHARKHGLSYQFMKWRYCHRVVLAFILHFVRAYKPLQSFYVYYFI